MTDITNDDYGPGGWDDVELAGCQFFKIVQDVSHHSIADGDGWVPWAETGDTVELVAELRSHLDRFADAVKAARSELARVERTARLRASRRERAATS